MTRRARARRNKQRQSAPGTSQLDQGMNQLNPNPGNISSPPAPPPTKTEELPSPVTPPGGPRDQSDEWHNWVKEYRVWTHEQVMAGIWGRIWKLLGVISAATLITLYVGMNSFITMKVNDRLTNEQGQTMLRAAVESSIISSDSLNEQLDKRADEIITKTAGELAPGLVSPAVKHAIAEELDQTRVADIVKKAVGEDVLLQALVGQLLKSYNDTTDPVARVELIVLLKNFGRSDSRFHDLIVSEIKGAESVDLRAAALDAYQSATDTATAIGELEEILKRLETDANSNNNDFRYNSGLRSAYVTCLAQHSRDGALVVFTAWLHKVAVKKDESQGPEIAVQALTAMGTDAALRALVNLAHDPQIRSSALSGIANFKSKKPDADIQHEMVRNLWEIREVGRYRVIKSVGRDAFELQNLDTKESKTVSLVALNEPGQPEVQVGQDRNLQEQRALEIIETAASLLTLDDYDFLRDELWPNETVREADRREAHDALTVWATRLDREDWSDHPKDLPDHVARLLEDALTLPESLIAGEGVVPLPYAIRNCQESQLSNFARDVIKLHSDSVEKKLDIVKIREGAAVALSEAFQVDSQLEMKFLNEIKNEQTQDWPLLATFAAAVAKSPSTVDQRVRSFLLDVLVKGPSDRVVEVPARIAVAQALASVSDHETRRTICRTLLEFLPSLLNVSVDTESGEWTGDDADKFREIDSAVYDMTESGPDFPQNSIQEVVRTRLQEWVTTNSPATIRAREVLISVAARNSDVRAIEWTYPELSRTSEPARWKRCREALLLLARAVVGAQNQGIPDAPQDAAPTSQPEAQVLEGKWRVWFEEHVKPQLDEIAPITPAVAEDEPGISR